MGVCITEMYANYLQLRRQVRERKEYIYRKAKEEQERAIHEKKKKLKAAIECT